MSDCRSTAPVLQRTGWEKFETYRGNRRLVGRTREAFDPYVECRAVECPVSFALLVLFQSASPEHLPCPSCFLPSVL